MDLLTETIGRQAPPPDPAAGLQGGDDFAVIQILAVGTDGKRWRWRIIKSGAVIAESRLWVSTMDEALESGYAHAEVMESRTAQNLGEPLRKK